MREYWLFVFHWYIGQSDILHVSEWIYHHPCITGLILENVLKYPYRRSYLVVICEKCLLFIGVHAQGYEIWKKHIMYNDYHRINIFWNLNSFKLLHCIPAFHVSLYTKSICSMQLSLSIKTQLKSMTWSGTNTNCFITLSLLRCVLCISGYNYTL